MKNDNCLHCVYSFYLSLRFALVRCQSSAILATEKKTYFSTICSQCCLLHKRPSYLTDDDEKNALRKFKQPFVRLCVFVFCQNSKSLETGRRYN